MNQWFGFFWLVVWSGKEKEISIGIGEDNGEGNFGPFFVKVYRKGPFWITVAKPSIVYLNRKGPSCSQ